MTQPTRSDPLAKIAEEHRMLQKTLDRVESTFDLERLTAMLAELHGQLERHFTEEEAPEGLALTIEQAAPQNLRHLDHLFEEHRQMLQTTAEIQVRAQTLLEGPKAAILNDVKQLAEKLRNHEATETNLLTDSVLSDIGSGD